MGWDVLGDVPGQTGTGQCNFLGKSDRSSFIVIRARNHKSTRKAHWPGQAGTVYQKPGRDRTITMFFLWFLVLEFFFSCFRTYFSWFRTSFPVFRLLGEIDFVPGRPKTEKVVLKILLLPLSWVRETTGQGNISVPGQRTMVCPIPNCPRDVLSIGYPGLR